MTPEYFRTLARYNAWANRRLYDAVAGLPDDEYRRDRKAFFGSIHGTLNHILVGDRVWLGRIEGAEPGVESLDQILYGDFDGLRAARTSEDARIERLAGALTAGALVVPLVFETMAGEPVETPLPWVLSHFFNYQTHHRGQVHALLSQASVAPPPLDLIFFLREVGIS